MDLPRALNHRLRQSCCQCPMAHHISHSQTSLAGERNGDAACVKVSAMSWCVWAGGVDNSWGILLPLQRPRVRGCGDMLCKEDHPNPSCPHPPGVTFGWARLYAAVVSIQAVCQHPFHTQQSQAHQSGYRSAMIQYSVLFHLASTWKDLTTCTIQAPRWDSGNRNRPVITK